MTLAPQSSARHLYLAGRAEAARGRRDEAKNLVSQTTYDLA